MPPSGAVEWQLRWASGQTLILPQWGRSVRLAPPRRPWQACYDPTFDLLRSNPATQCGTLLAPTGSVSRTLRNTIGLYRFGMITSLTWSQSLRIARWSESLLSGQHRSAQECRVYGGYSQGGGFCFTALTGQFKI